MPIWHVDYFEQKSLESSKWREQFSLESPYLLEDRSSMVRCSLEFPTGKSVLISGEGTRSQDAPRKALSQTTTFPICSPRVHLSFLKVIHCPLSGLHLPSLSPLKWYKVRLFLYGLNSGPGRLHTASHWRSWLCSPHLGFPFWSDLSMIFRQVQTSRCRSWVIGGLLENESEMDEELDEAHWLLLQFFIFC
jgi:hypothetical protein